MTNKNTAVSGVTLQIGSETAAALWYNGAAVSATNTWDAGEVISVYYDGTYYQAFNAQGGGGKAEKIKYDNSQSGLASENVQGALDETSSEIFTAKSSWDLSNGGDFTWILGTIHDDTDYEDGNAVSSSSFHHVNIPVTSGTIVYLKARQSEPTAYAFLKDIDFSYTADNGTDISSHYSDGYSAATKILAGDEAKFEIPADCNYLCVMVGQTSGHVRVPQSNSYYNRKLVTKDSIVQVVGDSLTDIMSQKGVTNAISEATTCVGNNLISMSAMSVDVSNNSYLTAAKDVANNGAQFTVTVKATKYILFGRIYQLALESGKKYRLSFEYLNTAYETTVAFRDQSDVFISAFPDKLPVNSNYATYEVDFIAPANVYYLAFGSVNKGNVNTSLILKNFSCVELTAAKETIGDIIDEIESINEKILCWKVRDVTAVRVAGRITQEGYWGNIQNGYYSGEISVEAGRRYRITAPLTGESVIYWLTESDAGTHSNGDEAPVCSGVFKDSISAGNTKIVIAPADATAMSYFRLFNNVKRTPKIEEAVYPSENGDNENNSSYLMKSIPKIGCGTSIVSRDEDTYSHAPMILENNNFRFVFYQGSDSVTVEDGIGLAYSHVLLVHNKQTNKCKYIKVFDCENSDTIDGYACSKYYNETAVILNGTDTLLLRTGCHWNSKWVQIYKTYNAATDSLSSAQLQKLSYGGNSYDFTQKNYNTMLNTLYSAGVAVDYEERYTNQINNITYYNGNYYCVYAMATKAGSASGNIVPHFLASSPDGVIWEPVAKLFDDYTSETQIAIVGNIVYYVYRALWEGSYFAIFSIDGTMIQQPAKLANVASKPTIVYNSYHNKVIVGYNGVLGNSANRTKMVLAEIKYENNAYVINNLHSYINANGWNYFFFYPKPNGNILSVSVEDSRQFNAGSLDATTTTDVRIEEIDLLELMNN